MHRRAAAPTRPTRSTAVALLAGLAVPLVVLAGPGSASAAETGPDTSSTKTTWAVQPSTANGPTTRASFDYTVVPGTTLVDYVGISNYSNKPLTLEVYASDAFNTSTGGTDVLAGSPKPTDVGAWVQLVKRKVTIKASSRVDVPFRLVVPSNATPGDHVGAVVASLRTSVSDGRGRDLAVDRRVGTRVNLRVQGELDPRLEVSDLKTSYAPAVNLLGGRLTVTYTVKNPGNVQLASRQHLEVKALGVVGVKSVTLPELGKVLPGNTITQTHVVDGVAAGVVLSSTVTLEPFSVADDLGEEPAALSASSTTFAMPWALLGVILLVVLAVLWRRRSRRRRREREAAAISAAVEKARAEVQSERELATDHHETADRA